MPFIRLIIPLGLIVFGAVAAYMGLVVSATALGSGEISIASRGSGAPGEVVTQTIRRADDAGRYWRNVTGFGFAPALLGIAAVAFGWRRLGQ